MSELEQLLDRLRALDVRLALNGDRMTVDAPRGVLTPALQSELAANRDALKQWLRSGAARASLGERIVPRPRTGSMRVAHSQRRLWFLRQLDPSSLAYGLPVTMRLIGRLDVDAIGASIDDFVARHESLRMRFFDEDGEPRCAVVPMVKVPIERIDVGGAVEADREAVAFDAVLRTVRRPFDPSRTPLMRASLIRINDTTHLLCVVFDHIVSDLTSVAIFLQELAVSYARLTTAHGAPSSVHTLDYLDLVEWERLRFENGALEEHLDYWSSKLAGLPDSLPLPIDRQRPAVPSGRGGRVGSMLPKSVTESVRALARAESTTPFVVLLAAFKTLLARWSGITDVVVGTPVANRNRAEAERIFGLFVNSVVLRTDLSGSPTFSALLARVRETTREAFTHQETPFDVLVERFAPRRGIDRSPLFQVLFGFHQMALDSAGLPGLRCEMVDVPPDSARFDLSVDVFERPHGLGVAFEYSADLFDQDTVERMLASFGMLLGAALADPAQSIDRLPLMGSDERQKVVHGWNRSRTAIGPVLTLPARFVAGAQAAPDRVAISCRGVALTYGQLLRRSETLARRVAATGGGPGSRVGVLLERTPNLLVALLGVLRSGAAYVPIDPAYPDARIEAMIEDARLAVVVADEGLAARVGGRIPVIVPVDAEGSLGDGVEAELIAAPGASDPAYVIYTSGSTGRPKGVVVPHGALANLLESMVREPGFRESEVLAAVTTVSFDIAGLELYLPLLVGARIELIPREVASDGEALAKALESSGATLLQATPATWRLLLEAGWRGRPGFRALCGGEALSRDLADALLERAAEVWNLYGPTETTIWSTCERVTARTGPVSIGRPIANTQVYVVDPNGEPVPIGAAGEIWIGGDGLALGYHERPELTAERFVPDRFTQRAGARLYRTGDLGRWRSDGRLEHLGRIDQQIKLRGFRIEPGEIEAVLLQHDAVRQAVVVAREAIPGDVRLVAFLVPSKEALPEGALLRAHLRRQLPDYMVPSNYVCLARLPMTPNGKVDRNALPALPAEVVENEEAEVSMTPAQKQVAALWCEVLGCERVGLHANFFDLGGHSLLLLRLRAAMQRVLSRSIPLVELFQRTTVAAQAELLSAPPAVDSALIRARTRVSKMARG